MGNSHQLFEQLFKRDVSANDTGDFLAELTKEHPYFTAAQFFLLQKTTSDSNLYNSQAAKTAILFNNPLWLNYQLDQLSISAEAESGLAADEVDVTTVYDTEIEELEKVVPVPGDAIPGTVVEKENDVAPRAGNEMVLQENVVNEEHEIPLTDPAHLIEASAATAFAKEETEPEKEFIATTVNQNGLAEDKVHEAIELPALTDNITESEKEQSSVNGDEPIVGIEAGMETSSIKETLPETDLLNSTPAPILLKIEQPENSENGENVEEEVNGEQTDNKEIEPMNIRLNFTPDMSTTEETISFEPLHTSDYFASLGIKFHAEGKPADKLGKQLKSFTEWLKTMKKIHTEQLTATTEQTDLLIQKMAEKSNADADVLTEAMAEVLFQQGKAGKAIEVYQKLSLLDPSKSAYFAAKIGQIER